MKPTDNHPIFQKITEGTVTANDFNLLIQEAVPEGMRERLRRRTARNVTDSHTDEEGHQPLDGPVFADRIQPKREREGKTQMHGRGRTAHRASARTQRRTMARSFHESIKNLPAQVPPRFKASAEFVVEFLNKPQSEFGTKLETLDRTTLKTLATKLMAVPGINREWLEQFAR
jgi:hypothetical protein